MRFKEFLREGSEQPMEFQETIDAIKKNCKSFLRHKQFLFRGLNANSYYGLKRGGVGRGKREAKGLGAVELRGFINDVLQSKKFPTRDEATFCDSMGHNALTQFGDICYVFPKGKFDFVWFDYIMDLNYHADFKYLRDSNVFYKLLAANKNKSPLEIIDICQEAVKNEELNGEQLNGIDLYNLKDALVSLDRFYNELIDGNTKKFPKDLRNEILLRCKEYYYIRTFTRAQNIPSDYDRFAIEALIG